MSVRCLGLALTSRRLRVLQPLRTRVGIRLPRHGRAVATCRRSPGSVRWSTAAPRNLNKQILCAAGGGRRSGLTSKWQRVDLFGAGPHTCIEVRGGPPVLLAAAGRSGSGAISRVGAVCTHRCRGVLRPRRRAGHAALDTPRWTRCAGCAAIGVKSLLVVLGSSVAGKSSFLRAGLMPRLRREDRRFPVTPCPLPEGISLAVPKHE